MKIFYHKDWRGNFGDDLNEVFFSKYAPGYENSENFDKLYGIGTLLNNVHGDIKRSIIFGSGFGYGDSVEISDDSFVVGVRGPWTAKKLDLPPEKVVGDPAFLIDEIFPGVVTDGDYDVCALHHGTAELWNFNEYSSNEIVFLDPAVDIESYVETIRGARRVFAESLHAAILCCVYGKSFTPVSITTSLEPEKWRDFYELMGLKPVTALNLHSLGKPWLRYIATRGKVRRFYNPSFHGKRPSSDAVQLLLSHLDDVDDHCFMKSNDEIVLDIKERLRLAVLRLTEEL